MQVPLEQHATAAAPAELATTLVPSDPAAAAAPPTAAQTPALPDPQAPDAERPAKKVKESSSTVTTASLTTSGIRPTCHAASPPPRWTEPRRTGR
jgi:hypothetical protein